MILGGPKNPQSGRACAPGGSARQEAGDPPPLDGLWSFWHRPGGPLTGDERSIGRARVLHQAAPDGVDQARRGRMKEVTP